MKIISLQISNVLSFAHYEDLSAAPKILFEEGLNILIGQNGAGKSTALEAINLVFKRIILTYFNQNHDYYGRRSTIAPNERKSILARHNDQSSYVGFRLDPNWDAPPGKPQKIRLELQLDDIDDRNIGIIRDNFPHLARVVDHYSSESLGTDAPSPVAASSVVIDVTLNSTNTTYSARFTPDQSDFAVMYLTRYHLYRALIDFHNRENPSQLIPQLYEPFALIGGYRNYYNFTPSVSVQGQSAEQQVQGIRGGEHSRSASANEQGEPVIFSVVRLALAGKHFNEYGNVVADEAERLANNQDFIVRINKKLELVNLKIQVALTEKKSWSYGISLMDTKRNRPITDINSLSAGQKAIMHLVFEAYGRGELKGGVVIIDEPEIHLHYQFQHEYLRIIEEIKQEQRCQYILVTHSESLINSETIARVRRFALDENRHSTVLAPVIDADQKSLVKILDNTRSTYSFFARKVVLVEGDTDRYLFKAIFNSLRPDLDQEVAVLDIGGKGAYPKWKKFFSSFGLSVYYIGDFDNVYSLSFPEGTIVPRAEKDQIESTLKQAKLDNLSQQQKDEFTALCGPLFADTGKTTSPKRTLWKPVIDKFINFVTVSGTELATAARGNHPNLDQLIEAKYAKKIFILKAGAIEQYIGGGHADLNYVADFCENGLGHWLAGASPEVTEIKTIIGLIAQGQ